MTTPKIVPTTDLRDTSAGREAEQAAGL